MKSTKARLNRWFIGSSVIAGSTVVISWLNLGDNLVYFYTPAEAAVKARNLSGDQIRVGGMVKPETVDWKPTDLNLGFILTDFNGTEIEIQHTGIPPDLFKENQGVVVEGRIAEDGSSMKSHKLMVKHSEEYQTPEEGGVIDHELLKASIFKN